MLAPSILVVRKKRVLPYIVSATGCVFYLFDEYKQVRDGCCLRLRQIFLAHFLQLAAI